jgi:CubicO group peptidase (beta-lactamase class C family)
MLLLILQYPVTAQDFSAVDSFFSGKVTEKQLAGAVTLVAREGKIIHFRPYGYRDIEQSLPMDKNAIIPIASITKVFTSIGILILQEEGKLTVDDPVEKYLPQFRHLKVYVNSDSPETENLTTKPTIRHLLTHTSGFLYGGKSYDEAGFREWNRPLSEFIDGITAIPLAFQPGINWKYSYSYDVLGHLIEALSGVPLDRFLKERIFRPLGMHDTDFYVPEEKAEQQSDLYLYENDSLKKIDSRHHSIYRHLPVALSGGGGWYDAYGGAVSTVSDFYMLADWLLNRNKNLHTDILSYNSLKIMLSNQIGELAASGQSKYGLGTGIVVEDNGETKEIFWAGSPYNTYFWINYEKKEIGIMFTNTAPFGHLDMMNKFKEIVSQLKQ